nr:GatB/YqeY domain-containing protein [Actinomycetales bacterium]
ATNESEHVAKAALGVGSAEAERRSLTSEELREILRSEIGERTAAAAEYEAHGRQDVAERLHGEVAVLTRYV